MTDMRCSSLDCTHLQVIADLTAKLTEIRAAHCNHLSIENFAPDLFNSLLAAYLRAHLVETTQTIDLGCIDCGVRDGSHHPYCSVKNA